MACRVDNAAVPVGQDQVRVPTHDFKDQHAVHVVAQLVHRIHGEMHHAVAANLLEGHNASAQQLLP